MSIIENMDEEFTLLEQAKQLESKLKAYGEVESSDGNFTILMTNIRILISDVKALERKALELQYAFQLQQLTYDIFYTEENDE